MPGSTAQTNKFHTFYLQQRAEKSVTWADIKVNHQLDYESIKEYNLTIRVEVCTKRGCYFTDVKKRCVSFAICTGLREASWDESRSYRWLCNAFERESLGENLGELAITKLLMFLVSSLRRR